MKYVSFQLCLFECLCLDKAKMFYYSYQLHIFICTVVLMYWTWENEFDTLSAESNLFMQFYCYSILEVLTLLFLSPWACLSNNAWGNFYLIWWKTERVGKGSCSSVKNFVQLRGWIYCTVMSRAACGYLKLHQIAVSAWEGSGVELGEVAGEWEWQEELGLQCRMG